MPFTSKAQSRFMHAVHPGIAKRWDKETSNPKKLPNKKKSYTKGAVKTALKHG